MAKLTPEEKERRRLEREAEQKARIEEYARKLAAEAPPLTQAQIDKIAILLRGRT